MPEGIKRNIVVFSRLAVKLVLVKEKKRTKVGTLLMMSSASEPWNKMDRNGDLAENITSLRLQ